MSSLAVLFSVKYALLAAIAVSLVLTPIARHVARRLRVVDMPDGVRKQHARNVPLWGGVVVYLAVLTGLLVVRCTTPVSEAFDQLATTLVLELRPGVRGGLRRRQSRSESAFQAAVADRRRVAGRGQRILFRSDRGLRPAAGFRLAGNAADGAVAGRLHQRA